MNREYEALRLRYEALSRDWNRLRDIEEEWRLLRNRVIHWSLLIAALWMGYEAFAVIAGWR